MHVLVFSYYWPPASGPGVQRWVKMCNHLASQGVSVSVITVADGSYSAIDHSMVSDVSPDVKVYKTKTLEPFAIFNLLQGKKGKGSSVGMIGLDSRSSLFKRISIWVRANWMIPDARKFWKGYALRQAENVFASERITHIITTGPPHSTHGIGLALKAKYGLPWIADLRDPWVNIHYHDIFPLTERTRAKHQALENEVLKKADHVTVVSPGMKREFADRCTDISVIFNGFDEQDMEVEPLRHPDKFTIRYVGNLKPNQEVPGFNEALTQCMKSIEGFSEATRIQLIGNKDEGLLNRMKAYQRSVIIESIDPVDHSTAVGYMKGADLLLFIVPAATNSKLIITGKLFEYLASERPILAIGPKDGDAANIIYDARGEYMLDRDDTPGLVKAISEGFATWKTGRTDTESAKRIAKYSRSAQTSVLMDILHSTARD